jgi:hypothetical protein
LEFLQNLDIMCYNTTCMTAIQVKITEIVQTAEGSLLELLREQSGVEEIELCLSVMKSVASVRDSLLPTGKVADSITSPDGADQADEVGFRYEVKAGQLFRFGRRENGGEYQQSVDRQIFNRIVHAIGNLLAKGHGRIRATLVNGELPGVPYYQVNLTVSFLRDQAVLDNPPRDAQKFKKLTDDLWIKFSSGGGG